ncbi:hypothetical protein AGMMS49545_22560 [Betaproteobacteria bacterium]|nr:hypothetical protein AGMMS49545_22560 [Betaproteobacteria bacterium]GHU47415.1 hypothetical protein AGMMS50289_22580 [Betaproteobacteria bacterium]
MPNPPQGLSLFIPGNRAVLKFAEQPEAMKIVLAEVLQGKSAYEIWLAAGNTGTEDDFLAALGGGGKVDTVAGISPDEEKNIPLQGLAEAILETGMFLGKGIWGAYTPPHYNAANTEF